MPGFSEGMGNVSRDEQRHIGFGVKVLSELFAETDECKAGRGRAAARGHALLARGLRAAGLGRALHDRVRLHAGGHLRLRDALGARRSGGRPASRSRRCRPRLSRSTSRCPHEERAAPADQAAEGRRHRRAERAPDSSPGGPAALLRRDRAAPPTPGRQRRRPHLSSGASATPTPGTWWSTTARPAPSRARPPDPTSPWRPTGSSGSTCPGAWTRSRSSRALRARRARCGRTGRPRRAERGSRRVFTRAVAVEPLNRRRAGRRPRPLGLQLGGEREQRPLVAVAADQLHRQRHAVGGEARRGRRPRGCRGGSRAA